MTALLLVGLVLGVVLGLPATAVALGFVSRALWTGVRLPDPPPDAKPDQRLSFALRLGFREWLSTLLLIVGWPLGLGNSKPTIDDSSERRPLPRARPAAPTLPVTRSAWMAGTRGWPRP